MGQANGAIQSGAKIEDEFHVQKVRLGTGSFGVVWRGIHKASGDVVAVKTIEKAKMRRLGVSLEQLQNEIQILKGCEHENILGYRGTFEDGTSYMLVTDYCEGGDFGDKMKERHESLTDEDVGSWLRDVLSAIAYLHARGIVHRDIKPDNFLVLDHSRNSTLRLADFGLATRLSNGSLLREKCGTPAFQAPEVHNLPNSSQGYDFRVDEWAAGLSMYMMFTGGERHPFVTKDNKLRLPELLKGQISVEVERGGDDGFAGQIANMGKMFFEVIAGTLGFQCEI
jgi:serine/threonine protein kinase